MLSKKTFALMLLAGVVMSVRALDIHEGLNTSDGRYRTYFLHTPPGYDGKTPLPMVISLHYGGGTGEGMAAVTRMSVKADQEGFIVAYPDAIRPGWTDYDAVFLPELVDTLCTRYAVDTLRVYMTGYSAGALMTHWMACKMSDKVGAFAPVAGTMLTYDWIGCFPERDLSIISFNARNDPSVLYEGDGEYYTPVEEAMSNWAERLGCDIGPDSFYNETGALRQTWSRSDSACEVVLWTTEDGYHDWPSDSSPHKLSANDLMWEFFLAHPIPVEETEPTLEEPASNSYVLDPDNPSIFAQSLHIRFYLSDPEYVHLEIFDALGRRIVTVLDRCLDSGEHSALIDVTGFRNGVYFWRLATPTFTETERFQVVR